jgi:hypothetical protein
VDFFKWLNKPVFANAAEPEAEAAEPEAEAAEPEPEAAEPEPEAAPAAAEPPAVAPAPPAAPAPAADTASEPWKLSPVIRAVLAAVATAIGVVGLATLVGGAVTWVRLSQVGLPTQTALSLLAKNDLVALGATGLVIYVGLAILLVAVLFAADPTGRVTGFTLLTLLVLGIAAVVYVLAAAFSWTSRAVLIAVVIALFAACLRLGPATDKRFLPFGVAAFFGVLLFGAATTYRFESDHPKVQPAAVVQDKGPGVIGFFIAASEDRVYLARLQRGDRPGALYDLNRDSKTRFAVGRRMSCEFGHGVNVACTEAILAAGELRKKLISDRRRSKALVAMKAKKKKRKKKQQQQG